MTTSTTVTEASTASEAQPKSNAIAPHFSILLQPKCASNGGKVIESGDARTQRQWRTSRRHQSKHLTENKTISENTIPLEPEAATNQSDVSLPLFKQAFQIASRKYSGVLSHTQVNVSTAVISDTPQCRNETRFYLTREQLPQRCASLIVPARYATLLESQDPQLYMSLHSDVDDCAANDDEDDAETIEDDAFHLSDSDDSENTLVCHDYEIHFEDPTNLDLTFSFHHHPKSNQHPTKSPESISLETAKRLYLNSYSKLCYGSRSNERLIAIRGLMVKLVKAHPALILALQQDQTTTKPRPEIHD
ncbi:hypothetical protein BDR26DRAFT_848746 [Obelidium mucronatum]|nr:hypothetical protein BDR26DRAFT_848746 [Obelidium mucronatum]